MKLHWLIILAFIAVLGLALQMRLGNLGGRPMHADEANNTIIFQTLYESGSYEYSPLDHHGPSLYYLTLPVVWLSGAPDFNSTNEATYRTLSVVFGIILIAMLYLVRDALGWPALIAAGLLLAVSPAMVFYHRYYIHEPLLIVFTFGLIVAGWRYYVRPSLGWAIVAGLSAGLMFATKETSVILWASMAAGIATVWITRPQRDIRALLTAVPPQHLIAAFVAASLVIVLLFSAFFRHPQGIADSVLSYFNYAQRAQGAGHEAPWYTYLKLLAYYHRDDTMRAPWWSEGVILLLAVLGACLAFVGRGLPAANRDFARFLAVYTFCVTLIFAAIPYKTPWNVLPFLHGMILLAGIAAAGMLMHLPRYARPVALILLLIALAHLRIQADRATSERHHANRDNPYVYAHTTTDTTRQLLPFLDRIAAAAPPDQPLVIQIYCDNAWPLPWYLRTYKHVGYGNQQAVHPQAGIVLVELADYADFAHWQEKLGPNWRNPGNYTLRPNVFLTAFVREDLFQAMLRQSARPTAAN